MTEDDKNTITDDEIWEYTTRNDKKLRYKEKIIPDTPPVTNRKTDKEIINTSVANKYHYIKNGESSGVDKNLTAKLKGGKMNIEGKLDLHGLTQDQAFSALNNFLNNSHLSGKRCLLIITGKGISSTGVLRKNVPEWLNLPENRSKILMFSYAQQKDGGEGALYVLLRRKNS